MFVLLAALAGLLVGCDDAPAPDLHTPGAVPGAVSGAGGAASAAVKTPDVIVVLVDTLRADHLSLYGYKRRTSPRIDAFAEDGAWFSRAYAQSGWTLASVTSLLTGQYPHQHRVVRDSRQPDRFGCLVPEVETLAEGMAGVGYGTAAFINNTFLAPEFGLQQGFDLYDYKGATNLAHRTANQTVDDAMVWWDAHADRPRFAVVHFMEPHLNYEAPTEFRGTFAKGEPPAQLAAVPGGGDPYVAMQFGQLEPTDESRDWAVRAYDEEVLTVDAAFGRLVDSLSERGDLEGTVVVLTADHGEEFWDHDGFEHGHSLWSELTRVPLVVGGPGAPTGRVDTVVEQVDLFQGVLALAGAPRPAASAGEDLFAVARTPAKRVALMENCLYGEPCISVVTDLHRFVFNPMRGFGGVHPILPDASDGPQLQGKLQADAGKLLVEVLRERRGGLAPVEAVAGGPRVPSFETFELLSQLGYVDRPGQDGSGPGGGERLPCGQVAAP
jgi:hypothetical protein